MTKNKYILGFLTQLKVLKSQQLYESLTLMFIVETIIIKE